jgi:hypothetical protein
LLLQGCNLLGKRWLLLLLLLLFLQLLRWWLKLQLGLLGLLRLWLQRLRLSQLLSCLRLRLPR